jgi:hypothetical protein
MDDSLKKRSLIRKKKITVDKVDLHSTEHHSLHREADGDTMSRLIFDLTRSVYGETFPPVLDRSVVKIVKLRERRDV